MTDTRLRRVYLMCSIRYTVHPPSNGDIRRVPRRWLQPGDPVTPGKGRLGLLPSGPDPLHDFPPLQDPIFNTN